MYLHIECAQFGKDLLDKYKKIWYSLRMKTICCGTADTGKSWEKDRPDAEPQITQKFRFEKLQKLPILHKSEE